MVPLAPSSLVTGENGQTFLGSLAVQRDFSWEGNVRRRCGQGEAGRVLSRCLPFPDGLSNSPNLWR